MRLTVEGGEPHTLVVRRMLEAIGSGAERLLVGRDSEMVARQEAALGAVLREVVDRVVRGYRVVEIGFQPGVTTGVSVRVQPLPPVLGESPVEIAMPGVHADVRPLVGAVLDAATPELRRLTDRLPADAVEWAGPILERRAVEIVEATAAGFSGQAAITTAPTRLSITLAPKDSRVIRDIGVRFRSSSIPYVLLSGHAPQVASMAESLRGLPVVFATAQRARLEALIAQRLEVYPPVRDYAVVTRPVLQVAEVTYVTVLADSTLYRGRIEARLNFGTQAPPPDVRATLGRLFGSLEPYVEITLVPSNLALRGAVGVRFELGTNMAIGASTGFDGDGISSFVTYRLSPDLQVYAKYVSRSDLVEGTLSYRINEVLSVEGVASSDRTVWLRLVSNL
ncbi:MAG: hypothetical protein QN178_07910 [Armatimonadota bacterium]|nr:hypothetical protein [Armatimonadota bacterium]